MNEIGGDGIRRSKEVSVRDPIADEIFENYKVVRDVDKHDILGFFNNLVESPLHSSQVIIQPQTSEKVNR